MNPKSIHLNPSEWHVMEFLWAHGLPPAARPARPSDGKTGLEPQHHPHPPAPAGGEGRRGQRRGNRPQNLPTPGGPGGGRPPGDGRISWTVSTRAASASWSVP